MKTFLNLSNGREYELDFHGVIHVTQSGRYGGCIEFKGGLGPIQYQWVQSAIDSACDYFEQSSLNADDILAIGAAVRRIMKPAPIEITNEQMGLIYAGLCCGACEARENGHGSDAAKFNELFQLLNSARLSDYDFKIIIQ